MTNRVSRFGHSFSPCFRSMFLRELIGIWGIPYLTALRSVVGLSNTPEKQHDCSLRQSLNCRTE